MNGEESLNHLADGLVAHVHGLMRSARTEEELRIGCEKLLGPLLKTIGIESEPKYERAGGGARTAYRGRSDAVHGQVIIEYEAPGAFASARAVNHAREQLVAYLSAEARGGEDGAFERLTRLVGVGFDGHSIFFVRYQGKKSGKVSAINQAAFAQQGPFPFDSESARTFLTYLRALSRRPLTAEHLADRFGPKSKIAPTAVSALADALRNWGNARVQVFFGEWKRLFGIVYGERFGTQGDGKALAELYGVDKAADFQELLFSVHTYFALLMKLIAAELVTINEGTLATTFCHRLVHASKVDLRKYLADIEDGGVYAQRGISNFLEGDFFRWHLDAASPRLEEAVREMARALADFEPATTTIDSEATRDLLKKLYQYLVPQEVRHSLGEYYTPDWLAELALDEVGYDGDTRKRLLDPACGSGTFLVLAIQRAREHGRKHREPPLEVAKRISANIWGFDLNPLAVIAARTNYLFALGDLAAKLSTLEIPIYLADSVLWPKKVGQMLLGEQEDAVGIPTSLQTFFVPKIWVERSDLMRLAAPLVEKMVREKYSPVEALKRLRKEGAVFPPHEKVVGNFYEQLLKLETEGKNGIWARFLKNISAPRIAAKFDFVVGNPPWIRWGYLSAEYRSATLEMWQRYGLFSLKGHAARLGAGEKDFSMLFTYAAADYYMAKGGKLAFLITQEVFKSKGAGEGFRRFRIGDGRDEIPLQVLKAHDLVAVQPFEGATNKTAAIILRKGHETEYPLPYTVWTRRKGVGKIPTHLSLEEALPLLQKKKLLAQPIDSATGSWQTTSKEQTGLKKMLGLNPYQARLGARVEPYGVFWLEIKQVMANGDLLVRNLSEKGERKVPSVEERIEPDLVFPAVRGADIERWNAKPGIFTLIVQDRKTRAGFSDSMMKGKWPRTYGYLLRFKEILLDRAAYRKYHAETGNPFYSQYNVADYTFARYRVVWKRMTNDLIAAVISQHKTPFGYKKIIPTDTTALFATEDENEAHYLCAVINSSPVREFIKSYSSAGRGFGTPSVMKYVGIPKFDPRAKVHKKLAALSATLHELKAAGKAEELPGLEQEVDEQVARLFGAGGAE